MDSSLLIHKNAVVEPGASIGPGVSVGAFTRILSGAVIGSECTIGDQVFIEGEVSIGDRVTIKNGVQVWSTIAIEDDVFVGPNVTFTNETFPRLEQTPQILTPTIVRQGASIGANATILPGITIGSKSIVGAGSVVTHDIPPNAIVVGNPARIKGYVSTATQKPPVSHPDIEAAAPLCVSEVKLIKLPLVVDLRGSLTFGEYSRHLPFDPHRYFVVFGVPSTEVRGEHAHKEQHQFLVCLKGSCSVVVDNGRDREEIQLNRPNNGLYIPPMIWATQYKYTSDAVLLVLASGVYDADDYIRNYDQYIHLVNRNED